MQKSKSCSFAPPPPKKEQSCFNTTKQLLLDSLLRVCSLNLWNTWSTILQNLSKYIYQEKGQCCMSKESFLDLTTLIPGMEHALPHVCLYLRSLIQLLIETCNWAVISEVEYFVHILPAMLCLLVDSPRVDSTLNFPEQKLWNFIRLRGELN